MKTRKIHRRRHPPARSQSTQRHKVKTGEPAEIEIKLEVPESAWDGLVRDLDGIDATLVPLRAIYFDTPGHELSRAGIALRVRFDGHQWVQTLKAPGSHALERVEDEVVIGPAVPDEPPPPVDLTRHGSQGAQLALRSALALEDGALPPATQPVFEVSVQRRVWRSTEGGSLIELALDEGEIRAGDRSRPIRELELELVEGRVGDLLVLARGWRRRGLWLNTASKAARGFRLAAGEFHGPAVSAKAVKLPAKPTMGQFTQAVLASCLNQVMENGSEVAAGSQDDDHVHQLRIGLRRLRTALRELPSLAEERGRVEPVLVDVFRGLGERRDRTHVLRKIQPVVEAAGGAALRVPAQFDEGADPGELVRRGAFQDALLSLLLCADRAGRSAGKHVRRTVRAHLAKLHRQVARDGTRFTKLSIDRQHQVRKRLKRLRYLGEFAAPLYKPDDVHRYLATLKPAQDALGQYNDEVIAQGLYEELVGADPGARFGVEWLQSQRAKRAKTCRKALRKLEGERAFWKRR